MGKSPSVAKPPDKLVKALKNGNAVAIVGSGLSIPAGGPTWGELLNGLLIEACERFPKKNDTVWAAFDAIRAGRFLNAASLLKSVFGVNEFGATVARQITHTLPERLRREFDSLTALRNAIADGVEFENRELLPTPVHRMLVMMGFRAIVTTNYDKLLEQASPQLVQRSVYTPAATKLSEKIGRDRDWFILKVHGDIKRPEEIILAREDYADVMYGELRTPLKSLLMQNVPFWIGYGHNDPTLDSLMDECYVDQQLSGGAALAMHSDLEQRRRFEAMNVIPWYFEDFSQIPDYIRRLASDVGKPVVFEVVCNRNWARETSRLAEGYKLAAELSEIGGLTDLGEVRLWRAEDLRSATCFYFETNAITLQTLTGLLRTGGALPYKSLVELAAKSFADFPLDSNRLAELASQLNANPVQLQDRLKPDFYVPYPPNRYFEDRPELSQVTEAFWGQKQVRVQAITGMAGLGKTQLAIQYAHNCKDKYDAVLWFDASTAEKIAAQSRQYADKIGLQCERDIALEAISYWLGSKGGRWLCIFDCEVDVKPLEAMIAQLPSDGHILITVRDEPSAYEQQKTFWIDAIQALQPLSIKQSVRFLFQRTHREQRLASDEERAAVVRISGDFGGLPLALEHVGNYVQVHRASFVSYLTLLADSSDFAPKWIDAFERDLATHPLVGPHTWGILNCLALSFDSIRESNPVTAECCIFLALFGPDHIPFKVLSGNSGCLGKRLSATLAEASDQPLLINELLLPAAQQRLIDMHEDNSVSMHRVVRAWLRSRIENHVQLVECAIATIQAIFPFDETPETQKLRWRLAPHVVEVACCGNSLNVQSLQAGKLYGNAGEVLYDAGESERAIPLLDAAIECLSDEEAEEDASRHFERAYGNLALAYEETSMFLRAEELHREQLQRLMGNDKNKEVTACENNLAICLYRQKDDTKYSEAEKLLKRVSAAYKTLLEPDTSTFHHIATPLNNLGELKYQMGDFSASQEYFQEALRIRRTESAPPDYIALTLINLGLLYLARNEPELAEEQLKQALNLTPNYTRSAIARDIARRLDELPAKLRSMFDRSGLDGRQE